MEVVSTPAYMRDAIVLSRGQYINTVGKVTRERGVMRESRFPRVWGRGDLEEELPELEGFREEILRCVV